MRVPTYEEATSPQFENTARFEAADMMLAERLGALCEQRVVHGALLFGSASFDDANLGSDRDLIIAYEGPAHINEPAVVPQLHHVAQEVYRTTSVHLEATCATLQQFQDGEHTLATPMLEWLKEQPARFPQDTIGNDFVHTIGEQRKLPHTDFTELEGFLMRTHKMLLKEHLQGAYFRPHDLLGQIYSTPHIAARKTLDALQRNGFIDHTTLTDL